MQEVKVVPLKPPTGKLLFLKVIVAMLNTFKVSVHFFKMILFCKARRPRLKGPRMELKIF